MFHKFVMELLHTWDLLLSCHLGFPFNCSFWYTIKINVGESRKIVSIYFSLCACFNLRVVMYEAFSVFRGAQRVSHPNTA